MGLYNFQARFVPFILSGEKTHTIRSIRANPDKPGNTLHLYTGLRQKGARLLFRAECIRVEEIVITPGSMVRVAGQWLEEDECEALARRDGFPDFASMMKFWKEPRDRTPFRGHVIHWRKP